MRVAATASFIIRGLLDSCDEEKSGSGMMGVGQNQAYEAVRWGDIPSFGLGKVRFSRAI